MLKDNKHKTVFLTGASRGIGYAIGKKLIKEKYHIIAPKRQELDLANEQSVSRYLEKHKNISVDILINNAGINSPQWVHELEDENITNTMAINLLTPIRLIRTYAHYMMRKKWGRIINISSMFGIIARGKQVLYASSKHGLNGITKALAVELGPYNILVNSVCPGFTKTELTLRNSPEKNEALSKSIPLGRFAEPEEVAELVAFLISEKNTYITGTEILIDGGYTCQ